MKIKLSDIAKRMGISTAAVSMAVNNKPGVSDETRQEVLRIAEEMGYRHRRPVTIVKDEEPLPKRFIKLLRIRKHGLVVMETAFFSALIEGIEKQSKEMGYELLMSNMTIDPAIPNQIKDEYHEDVDGIIALCTELDEEDITGLLELTCPRVVLDRRFEDNIDTVLMNNQKAAKQAVECFSRNGHSHIGYLKSSTRIYNFDSRYRGYLKSMENKGLKVEASHIAYLEPTIDGAYRDMLAYLKGMGPGTLPTAFMADNDNIALGAMNAFKDMNINVPEDVSIIGIDDMPFCTIISPQLSTIRIYKQEIGRLAVKMLVEQSLGEVECTRKVEVDTTLVERASVLKLN